MSSRAELFALLSTAEQALALALDNGASEAKALELSGRQRMPTGKRLKALQAWLAAPADIDTRDHVFDINEQAIAQELAALAFSNPRNYFDNDGRLLSIQDMRSVDVKAIKEISVKVLKSSNTTQVLESTIKFYDKKAALELLGKWKEIGMFVEKIGTNEDDPLARLLANIGNRNVNASPLPSGD